MQKISLRLAGDGEPFLKLLETIPMVRILKTVRDSSNHICEDDHIRDHVQGRICVKSRRLLR